MRDFYQSVTGWTPSPVEMGGYQDFCMHPPGEAQPVAGICHARGQNTGLPPVWMVYITVADLDESLRRLPGTRRQDHPAGHQHGRARTLLCNPDPAGAVCALFETAEPAVRTPAYFSG